LIYVELLVLSRGLEPRTLQVEAARSSN